MRRARRVPADIATARVIDRRLISAGEFAADHLAARIGVGDRALAVG